MSKIRSEREIFNQRSQNFAEKIVAYEEIIFENKRQIQNAARKIQVEENKMKSIQNEIEKYSYIFKSRFKS